MGEVVGNLGGQDKGYPLVALESWKEVVDEEESCEILKLFCCKQIFTTDLREKGDWTIPSTFLWRASIVMISIKYSISLPFPRFHVSTFPGLLLAIAWHLNILGKIHLYWSGEGVVIAMGGDTIGPAPTNQI